MSASELPSLRAYEDSNAWTVGYVALAILLLFPSTAQASYYAWNFLAPEVYLEYVEVPYGSTLVASTDDLSSGADSVMHLFTADDEANLAQVAYSDNYDGSLRSHIAYYNGSPSRLRFLILVRSKFYTTYRTARITVSVGGQVKTDSELIPVNMGLHPWSHIWESGPDHALHTVEIPGGSTWPFLACFNSSGDSFISELGLKGGVGHGVRIAAEGNCAHYLLGTACIRDELGGYDVPRTGLARILVNDVLYEDGEYVAGDDEDGDGLGDDLESALGTCNGVSTCSYIGTVFTADTDRDGLLDGDEVLGIAGLSENDGQDDLPLYRYGANPLQKDVFVEVDHMDALGHDPIEAQDANPANTLAWVNAIRAPYLEGPTEQLKNPNGQDGVLVHLDINAVPVDGDDEDKYADWGSMSERGIFSRRRMRVFEPLADGTLWMRVGSANWEYMQVDEDVTPEEIVSHFALYIENDCSNVTPVIRDDCGGDCRTVFVASDDPASYPPVSVYYWNIADGGTFDPYIAGVLEVGDEIADEMRNRWRGDYPEDRYMADEVRHDRFHYALISGTGTGGQAAATGDNLQSGLNAFAFMHELGHNVGIRHSGRSEWGTGGLNCMPHYESLMNYAFMYKSSYDNFNSDDSGLTLNPADAWETNAVPGLDTGYLAQAPFGLTADSTHVDWDRSGGYNYSYSIKAITNLTEGPGGSKNCSTFSSGLTNIAGNSDILGAVDLLRVPASNNLFSIYAVITGTGETEIRYRSAALGPRDNSSCTGSSNPSDDGAPPCLTWASERTLSDIVENPQGLSSAADNGYVHLAYRDENDFLRSRVYLPVGEELWPLPDLANVIGLTNKSPELVVIYQDPASGQGWENRLAVLWTSSLERYHMAYFNYANDTWAGQAIQSEASSGLEIVGNTSPAAVSWPDPYNSHVPDSRRTACALFPDLNNDLQFYCRDNTGTNEWHNLTSNVFGSASLPDASASKPSLAYRMLRYGVSNEPVHQSYNLGHFMIGYEHATERVPYIAVTRRVYYSPLVVTPQVLDTHSYFRNYWFKIQAGTNLALYEDSTMGSMMGLQPILTGNEHGVYFFPHADGSPNQPMSVYSDFKVMEDSICRGLFRDYRDQHCGVSDVMD